MHPIFQRISHHEALNLERHMGIRQSLLTEKRKTGIFKTDLVKVAGFLILQYTTILFGLAKI